MNLAAGKTALVALLVVLALSGCRKKKEPTVTPQAQAPTVSTPQKPGTTTAPAEPAVRQPATTAPSATATSPSAPTATTTPKPKPRRQPKPPKQPAAASTNGEVQNTGTKPPAEAPATTASTVTPAPGAPSVPPKVVVQDGGEPPAGQISAAGGNHEGSRQSIEELLQSTDSNLRSITRQLSDNERGMVEQIRNYMAQARVASTDGDLTRANNLALKAHLLSDELVKR